VGRAHYAGNQPARHRDEPAPAPRRHSGGDRLPVRAAVPARFRRRRRLRLVLAGPQREPLGAGIERTGPGLPRGGEKTARADGAFHLVRSHRAADRARGGPRKGPHAGRPDQRCVCHPAGLAGRGLCQRFQPLWPPLPRLCAGRFRLPPEAGGHRPVLRPQPHHQRHDSAVHPGQGESVRGHRNDDPLQPDALGGNHRPGGGRLQLGSGHGGRRRGSRRSPAARDGPGLHRAFLPGKNGAEFHADLDPRGGLRLPAPGRALRKLALALERDAHHPDRPAGGVPARVGLRFRQQHLCPDRAGHADRPGR